MRGIDHLLARIRDQMDLDSETEHSVLAEIRNHFAQPKPDEEATRAKCAS